MIFSWNARRSLPAKKPVKEDKKYLQYFQNLASEDIGQPCATVIDYGLPMQPYSKHASNMKAGMSFIEMNSLTFKFSE